ncbi:MAG: DUF4340 domain-containing protein, partial [Gemmatimonadetes bacterium]|nr:DUF4340 domain-containing protein [Gemmatimonadota bacterium]
MRLKTNFVISVVFAALLAFVYFYEIKGGDERELDAERARQVIDFSDHEAQRLTIAGPETTLVIERRETGWEIRQPIETHADSESIDRYLRNLKETEIEGEPVQDSAAVAGDSGLLAPYGLDSPRLSVHVALAPSAGTELDTLQFGIDTPTQRFTYVQLSGKNPEVRTVRAWRYDNLEKGLFDLRDRQVLHLDRDQVTELRLQRVGMAEEEQIVAMRRGGGWELTSPLKVAAEDAAVDEILNRLGNAKIESFIHEQPSEADLEQAGLAPDQHFIHLTLLEGEAHSERHLRVGSRQQRGDHYAMDVSRT